MTLPRPIDAVDDGRIRQAAVRAAGRAAVEDFRRAGAGHGTTAADRRAAALAGDHMRGAAAMRAAPAGRIQFRCRHALTRRAKAEQIQALLPDLDIHLVAVRMDAGNRERLRRVGALSAREQGQG